MIIFESKSSALVKVITIGIVIVLILVSGTISLQLIKYGLLPSIMPFVVLILTTLYFYLNSLNCIIFSVDYIILKKNFGQKAIHISEITSIERLSLSNLSITAGSRGVFGFIGSTMDNSYSFVKDRTKMVRITTKGKKYIFSCENPDELVGLLKRQKP